MYMCAEPKPQKLSHDMAKSSHDKWPFYLHLHTESEKLEALRLPFCIENLIKETNLTLRPSEFHRYLSEMAKKLFWICLGPQAAPLSTVVKTGISSLARLRTSSQSNE